jgi:hypothetical protein
MHVPRNWLVAIALSAACAHAPPHKAGDERLAVEKLERKNE